MLPHKNMPGSQHILHCPVNIAPPNMHPNDWIISHQSHTTLYPKNHITQPIQLDPIALDLFGHTPQPSTEFDYQRWILPFPPSFLPTPHSAELQPYKPHKIYRGARKHQQSDIRAYLERGLAPNHPGYIPYTQTMQLLTWLNEHMPVHVIEEYPNNNPHRPAKIHRRIWTEQHIDPVPIFGIYLGDGTNMPIYRLNNENLRQRFHGILIPNPMDLSLEGAFAYRPPLPTTAPTLSQHETIKHLRHIRDWANKHTPDIMDHLFPQQR